MASSENPFVGFNADSQQDPCIVTHLTTNDILMGRGAPLTYYEGNIKFRELVQPQKAEYVSSKNQNKKQQIAMQLYVDVERRGGRFLQKVPPRDAAMRDVPVGAQAWYTVSQEVALEKIKQALREKTTSDEPPPTMTASSPPVRMSSAPLEQPDPTMPLPITNQVAQPLLSLQNGTLAPNDSSQIVQHPTIGCEGIRQESWAANEYASLQPNGGETMLRSPANVANPYRNGPTDQADFSSLALLTMLRQHSNTQNHTGPTAIGRDQGGRSFDSAVLQFAQNAASVHERNQIMRQHQQLAQPIHQPSLLDLALARQQQPSIQRRQLLDLCLQQQQRPQLQVAPVSIAATNHFHQMNLASQFGLPGSLIGGVHTASLSPLPQTSPNQILNQLLDQRARSILQRQERSSVSLVAPVYVPTASTLPLSSVPFVTNNSHGATTNTSPAIAWYQTRPAPNAAATGASSAVSASTEVAASTSNADTFADPLVATTRDTSLAPTLTSPSNTDGSSPTHLADDVAAIAATAAAAISGATAWTPRTNPNNAEYWRDPGMAGLVSTLIPPPTHNNDADDDQSRACKRARL